MSGHRDIEAIEDELQDAREEETRAIWDQEDAEARAEEARDQVTDLEDELYEAKDAEKEEHGEPGGDDD